MDNDKTCCLLKHVAQMNSDQAVASLKMRGFLGGRLYRLVVADKIQQPRAIDPQQGFIYKY